MELEDKIQEESLFNKGAAIFALAGAIGLGVSGYNVHQDVKIYEEWSQQTVSKRQSESPQYVGLNPWWDAAILGVSFLAFFSGMYNLSNSEEY